MRTRPAAAALQCFAPLVFVLSVASTLCVEKIAAADATANQPCQTSGSFVQTRHLKGLPTPLTSRGVFFNDCGLGVIWSTQDPFPETLVIRRTGEAFRSEGEEYRPLRGRGGTVMARLIHPLMSGDLTALEKDFDIDASPGGAQWTFLPIKRPLNRALRSVELRFVEIEESITSRQVDIQVIDRREQLTKIEALEAWAQGGASLICGEQSSLPVSACDLLTTTSP